MKIFPPVSLFFYAAILITLVSCGQSEKEAAAFKDIAESLAASSKNLDMAAERKAKEMLARLEDRGLKAIAERYIPKASAARALSRKTSATIDSLSNLLSEKNYPDIATEADRVYQLHIHNLLAIDPQLPLVFPQWLSQKQRSENYHTLLLAKIFLSKLHYDISNTHESAVAFLDSKVSYGYILNFDKTSVLVGQSSTVLEPGQLLEITAGVGSYSTAAQAKFIINNKPVATDSEPYATAKIKVPQKPGSYNVPVEINYTDQEGEKVKKKYVIEYKVKG